MPMCLFLGRVIWPEPVLMIVQRRFVGSFMLNILSRSYYEKVLVGDRLCTTKVIVAICFEWAGESCREYS